MKKRRQELDIKYRVIIIIIIIFGLFLIISSSLKPEEKLNPVTRVIKDVTLTVVEIITAPVTYIKDLNTNYQKYLVNTKTPSYKQLKLENELLKAELTDFKQEANLTYSNQWSPLLAKVIVRNVNVWYNQLTINRGINDGITSGNAVMNRDGLIGIISSTSNRYATVNLLTNNREQTVVPATILGDKNQEFGYIQGFDPKEGTFLFHKINDNLTVKVGDRVVTSSLGGKLPIGLNIGVVSRIVRDEYGIITLLKITPTTKINQLNYVTVLLKVSK